MDGHNQNRNVPRYPPQHGATTTHHNWATPKPYPIPEKYYQPNHNYSYNLMTYCFYCQDTRQNLEHSSLNCPHSVCTQCRQQGHLAQICIEINKKAPPFTTIWKTKLDHTNSTKTPNKQLTKSLIPDLQPLQSNKTQAPPSPQLITQHQLRTTISYNSQTKTSLYNSETNDLSDISSDEFLSDISSDNLP
jgi:hypothetical protein